MHVKLDLTIRCYTRTETETETTHHDPLYRVIIQIRNMIGNHLTVIITSSDPNHFSSFTSLLHLDNFSCWLTDDNLGCSINRIWDSSRWLTRYLDSWFDGISSHGNQGVCYFYVDTIILIFMIIDYLIIAFIIVMIVVFAVTNRKSVEKFYKLILFMCVWLPLKDLRPGISIQFECVSSSSIVISLFTCHYWILNFYFRVSIVLL